MDESRVKYVCKIAAHMDEIKEMERQPHFMEAEEDERMKRLRMRKIYGH